MLSLGRHFFEVPIYRCSPDQHKEETSRRKTKYLAAFEHEIITNPENHDFAEKSFDRNVAYNWEYNEVIGYVRLYSLGTQIRGELWLMRAKRIVRGTKKNIHWIGKSFELDFTQGQSGFDIGMAVLNKLRTLTREKPLVGRYVDTQALSNSMKAINWRSLVGF